MNISKTNDFMIRILDLQKSYNGEPVLSGLNMVLKSGHTYCLMAPSGSGKTTLFRILMGLEGADSGQVLGMEKKQLAAVFQEDRLLEGYTALENIMFAAGRHHSAKQVMTIMQRILPAESLNKPVCEFSGGMKRRVAILRAILAPSDFIIMDEPFTGLDTETKMKVIELIREYGKDKLLLIATHAQEDSQLLSAEVLYLTKTGAAHI